ncbi:uncharacterized protein L199_003890 [Kwoniella botswanensis]|uniref:uncharacterized protein n=1 Tax=Kwoniella botswanensis TaxID=1268659 RepID=UPI00315CB71E
MRPSNLPSTPQTPSPVPRQTEQITQSRQLEKHKHNPLGAYPTPQSSLDVTSPLRSHSTTSSTRTNTSSTDERSQDGQGEDDNIGSYLEAHDRLRHLYPNEEKVPSARLCVLGAQSAGKSSFLSSLTNLDLYCAERRATCCRILISSRRGGTSFSADVQIVILHPGTERAEVIPFASSITDEGQMGQICNWAGEEARRADGGYQIVRSWSQVKTLSTEERIIGRSGWAEFTKNVVIINVRGPSRPNFDIEDLPGLNGHPIPQKLVSDCISQSQNIIVLCLSAGSKDASPADPEIQLARKYDPTGERTIGVITRADLMAASMDEEGSTFVDYLLGTGAHLGDFIPQGGWWPLRLRSHKERSSGTSLHQIRQKEVELFSEDDWLQIQEKAGRNFGIGELEKKLEVLFGAKVRETIVILKTSLRESMRNHNDWLVENPTIQDPIATLHDQVIYQFSNVLKGRIERSNASGKLVDLQEELEQVIQRAVPEFVPFTKDESEENGTYQSYCKTNGIVVEKEDTVYLDTLAEMIKGVSSRREPGVIDTTTITQAFVDKYTARWRTLANQHIDQLWREVEDIQRNVIKEICGNNAILSEEVSMKLEDLVTSLKIDSMSFMNQMCRIITSPLSHSGRGYAQGYQSALKRAIEGYSRFLQPSTGVHRREVSTSSSIPSQTNSSVPNIPSEIYSKTEREQCTALQAKITVLMMSRALEFSSSVGEHAQECVMEYLEKVIPTLRKKMGLDQVVEDVRKRAGDLFENDRKKKRERERVVGEMKKLDEIQQHLERIVHA